MKRKSGRFCSLGCLCEIKSKSVDKNVLNGGKSSFLFEKTCEIKVPTAQMFLRLACITCMYSTIDRVGMKVLCADCKI